MTTYLEQLAKPPLIKPANVVQKSHARGPKVKKNPDGTMCHVRTAYVQSHPLWLVLITYRPKGSFRVRVYLRQPFGGLLQILDKDGHHTRAGAEWSAFRALSEVARPTRKEEDQ